MHRETLVLRKKILGDKHPYILTSISNLAGALSHQGKYIKAEIINREILVLKEKISRKKKRK
jgi:hypothetical protein